MAFCPKCKGVMEAMQAVCPHCGYDFGPDPQAHVSHQRIRAVGGSCLGGVLGGVLGVVLGFSIIYISNEAKHKRNVKSENLITELLQPLDPCFQVFAALLGAGIGGIIGAVAGSALGAGMASRGSEQSSSVPSFPPPPPAVEGRTAAATPAPAAESSEVELARLRERIDELERKKQARNESPDS